MNQPTAATTDHSLLHFVRSREVQIAIVLQLVLSIFLAQGYDFLVSYVAGRNIGAGSSPYFGGAVSGWMAAGYGSQVQGIGETPLWALYLGLSYLLSGGQSFIFNFLSKLPIVAANVALAYFLHSKGAKGWRFFLFNAYLIVTTVTWGKPDNLATYLAFLALIAAGSATSSALLLSTSFMVKPLAVAILPAFFARLMSRPRRWGAEFIIETFVISAAMFLGPFVILGWPIETVTSGFVNWFSPAGALSPFNIVEIIYGTFTLPPNLWWAGYLAPSGILLLIAYSIMRPPRDVLQYALLSASIFFTLRPWTSEQNLVIVLTLFLLLTGALPSQWLWAVPILFAIMNNSLQQQLYLLRPTIIHEFDHLYALVNIYRLWLKFFLSLTWLGVLWFNVASVSRKLLRIPPREKGGGYSLAPSKFPHAGRGLKTNNEMMTYFDHYGCELTLGHLKRME